MERADEDHYFSIAEKLAGGRMIPFLGAGANLCDRGDEAWTPGSPFLPSGGELAEYLAARGRYPDPGDHNLLRVSQYVGAARGEDELYLLPPRDLRSRLSADVAAPTARTRRHVCSPRRASRNCSR